MGGARALSSDGNFPGDEEEDDDGTEFRGDYDEDWEDEDTEEEEEVELEGEPEAFYCDNVFEALKILCRLYDPTRTSLSDLCDSYGIDWHHEREGRRSPYQPNLFRR